MKKVYFGGGTHFQARLQYCKEVGEIVVEEVNPEGCKCFEDGRENLYRICMRVDGDRDDELFL